MGNKLKGKKSGLWDRWRDLLCIEDSKEMWL